MQHDLLRWPMVWAALTAMGLAHLAWGADAAADPDAMAARAEFAERITQLGQDWLRAGPTTIREPEVRQTAALIDAAVREDPRDPRYSRLLASAMEQMHDTDGAIKAWTAYRRLAPDDRVAQVKLIELYADRMQTVDRKLAYLQDLLTKPSLPNDVKAHLAAVCVPLLMNRSNDDAIAMVAQGLKYYPLPELLQWQYFLVAKHGGAADRVDGLLALLRANPIQPQVLQALGYELAHDGLPEAAVGWFSAAYQLNARLGKGNDRKFLLDLASELFVAGQTQSARGLTDSLVRAFPKDASFALLNLLIQRSTGDRAAFDDTLNQARNLCAEDWQELCNEIFATGSSQAQPGGEAPQAPPADAATVVQKLRELNNPKLNYPTVLVMENSAWLELFYGNDPHAAQQWVTALQSALPAGDPVLARLQGWTALELGNADDARKLLTPLAANDPLAALGLIQLDSDKGNARDSLRQLLASHPTGVVAASICEALDATEGDPSTHPAAATRPAPATTQPALAAAIKDKLARFPKAWLRLIDQPTLFYTLAAEPTQTTVRFGDALFARVSLINRTDFDLVIGFEGPIESHLWIDAQVSGITQRDFPAIAYDQITNVIVLKAHAATSQVIRIDQGELGEALRQRANGSMIVDADVMTNPETVGTGVAPGPGGEAMRFTRSFMRLPSDIDSPAGQQQLHDDLSHGTPDARLSALDLLGAYVISADKDANPAARASVGDYLDFITRARQDANPEVAAWAGYLSATLPGMSDRLATIQEMLGSAGWQSRLLALAALRKQPPEDQQRLAGPLGANDSDEVVKEMAAATVDLAKTPTTQPATQP